MKPKLNLPRIFLRVIDAVKNCWGRRSAADPRKGVSSTSRFLQVAQRAPGLQLSAAITHVPIGFSVIGGFGDTRDISGKNPQRKLTGSSG